VGLSPKVGRGPGGVELAIQSTRDEREMLAADTTTGGTDDRRTRGPAVIGSARRALSASSVPRSGGPRSSTADPFRSRLRSAPSRCGSSGVR
jgi:hypothetical protein